MNKNSMVILAFLLANSGCASERLSVKVVDDMGNSVSNATVHVDFSSSHIVLGEGTSHHYEAKTDAQGNAVVRFNCTTSDIGWYVDADGYYRSNPYAENFNGEDVVIPPGLTHVVLREHEKEGKTTLYKKRNPQPMMAHGVSYEEDQHLFPQVNGKYGFDIMKFDWLPPLGKGEVADFQFIRRVGEKVDDGVWGWLEFPEKCGIYVCKQTGCKNFPSTYEADTNGVFVSLVPFIFDHTDDGKAGITYKDIVGEDQYGVLRTRVFCDEWGNVIKANYSKVLGPFRMGEAYKGFVVYTPGAVFNPRVNDPNLESNPERSYDPNLKRPSLAP